MKIRRKNILDYFFRTLFSNRCSFDINYNKLKEITITLYKWLNMPPEIDERFLELQLFEKGHVLFFEDKELEKFVVMASTISGRWDIYNNPLKRRAYATNGYKADRTIDDSVLIYNNVLRNSSERETLYFAEKLGFYDQVINVNVNAQKTPIIIKCDENQRLTLENLYQKYDGNQPIIFGDKNLSSQPLEVLKTDAPFTAPDIYDMKVKYWNEFLTYKGVSNVNINKKERLSVDEVNRQLGGSIAARGSGLLMRKKACEEINKMYGLNIDVAFNEDVIMRIQDDEDILINENEIEETEGGLENE